MLRTRGPESVTMAGPMAFETDSSVPAPTTWQSKELFRQLVKGANDYAICMLDQGGAVVSWNTQRNRDPRQ
jgi:hypothetical protein